MSWPMMFLPFFHDIFEFLLGLVPFVVKGDACLLKAANGLAQGFEINIQ